MYVSEAAWFKRQQRKKAILKKVICMLGTLVLLIFFCACGVRVLQKDECGVAEAADVQKSENLNGLPNEEKYKLPGKSSDMIKVDVPLDKEVVEEENLLSPLIVIDAGHGGEDEGCSYGEMQEKDLNLNMATLLKENLEKRGFRVVLTRQNDEKLSLEERVEIANDAQGDLFISIHQNASEDKAVQGVETWYCEKQGEENKRLAMLMQQYVVLYGKSKDRGIVESDTLYVIRECEMPSCLVEVGFLSNSKEREKLNSQEYMEKLVQGMADAVELYFYPKKMYLTFDDGPSAENTMKVLDILKEKNVKATFFVVGENVEKNPEVAKRIVEEGHTIGIHCYNHSYDIVYESVESYLADFEKAKQIVLEVTGEEAWCFRFPGGSINTYNKEICEELVAIMTEKGYVYYDWNASLEDAVAKVTPEQLLQNAKQSTLQRKKIVMLAHDIVYSTTLCLEDLLNQFPEYEFLPITKDVLPVQF